MTALRSTDAAPPSLGPAPRWARATAVAALVAVALRVAFLRTPAGGLDGDEGVTGFMARRMAAGDDAYVFFVGQNYNGAIEQYPQALLFALGLPPTPMVLRIPQLALAAVACVLAFLVGRRMFRSDGHAALAAWLFALGPYFLVWKGARSFGSYSAELVVLLLALLWAIGDDPATRVRRTAGVGLCLGLTYWLTFSGYYLMIPIALWTLRDVWRDARALGAGAAGVVVGLVPVLYWMARFRDIPWPNPGYRPTSALERAGNLFDEVGREFIGVAHLVGRPGWPVWLGRATLWALLAVAVGAMVVRRRALAEVLLLRPRVRSGPIDILLLSVPLTVAAYVGSRYAWFTTEPRYLHTAFPVLLLGLVALVPRSGRGRVVGSVAVVLFVAVPSLTMLVTWSDDVPGTGDRDMEEVVDLLVAEGQTDVYAEYWTAMPLEFIAGDRLDVGSSVLPERLPEERAAVDRASAPVWVASRGANSDDIVRVRAALDRAGIDHRERTFGDVSVFDRFDRPVRPWDIRLGDPP